MQRADYQKLEELYQEFRTDEVNEKWIHNPAHFSDTEPFLYKTKELWFISRLVRKNKVKQYAIKKIWYKDIEQYDRWTKEYISEYNDDECLIMMLSIEDEPLEFLVSILK